MSMLMVTFIGLSVCFAAASEHNGAEDWYGRQKHINLLLEHIYDREAAPKYNESYVLNFNCNLTWKDVEMARTMLRYHKLGIMAINRIFTPLIVTYQEVAMTLFNAFLAAKNYKTFLALAYWARANVNAEMFLYAFSMAVFHGQYMKDNLIPPTHEITPYFFYNSTVLGQCANNVTVVAEHNRYPLNYFIEDPGWNTYFNFLTLTTLWDVQDDGLITGAYYTQQILSRFYLERISHNLVGIKCDNDTQDDSFQYFNKQKFVLCSKVVRNCEFNLLTTLSMNSKHGRLTCEHSESALRDPYYYKYLWQSHVMFQRTMAPYTSDQIVVNGTKIRSIKFSRLETFLEPSTIELHHVKSCFVKQLRLNHEPFNYTINVNSNVTKAVNIRVFIGPTDHRMRMVVTNILYYQLDNFTYHLKVGENIINRKSNQFPLFDEEPPTFTQLKQIVLKRGPIPKFPKQIPKRFLLPRGNAEGKEFHIFAALLDDSIDYDLGRPLDAKILSMVPNAILQKVYVYHKEKVNTK